MDEAELTRKAIEEIMREMDVEKEADKLPQKRERKLNPLGRPNKDFLDRTINSVMTHNKRQLERNRRKCQSKLRDMDEAGEQPKRQGRERYRAHRKIKRKRRRSDSTTSLSSRRDSSSSKERKSKHKKSKKKKKRNKKKTRSKSSSSTSSSPISIDTSFSSSSFNSSNKSYRKRRKPKDEYFEADEKEGFYPSQGEHVDPASLSYYVDPNMALAAMAYSHMNQILQQQQQSMHDLVKDELESNENDDNIDIPSDLSLTYHSESELNISLNSSSAEEDENGVLTFKLTSDEEQINNKTSTISARKRKLPSKPRAKWSRSKNSNENDSTLSDTSSEADKTSNKNAIADEDITIISSSSCSDNEHREEITILSSSSSETDNDETVNKQGEVTVVISCTSSTDTEEEDANKENQKEISMFNLDKDPETNTEASRSIVGGSDLTNFGNEKTENVINQSSQKQVEEATNLLSRSSSTSLKLDKLDIFHAETIDLNSAQEELAIKKISDNKVQEKTNSSSNSDITAENESPFVENQEESITVLNNDEKNTKISVLQNSLSKFFENKEPSCSIASKSDCEVTGKDLNETEREIFSSAPGQEETSTSNMSKDLECNAAGDKPEEVIFRIITEQNKAVKKENADTNLNGNAILEVKENDTKTNDNVTELHEKNTEVNQNCSVNEMTVLKEETEDAEINDNNVNGLANAIVVDVTDE